MFNRLPYFLTNTIVRTIPLALYSVTIITGLIPSAYIIPREREHIRASGPAFSRSLYDNTGPGGYSVSLGLLQASAVSLAQSLCMS